MLRSATSLVTELVDYGDDKTCAQTPAPLKAKMPSPPWYGFKARGNDTWESRMAVAMTMD